MTTKEKLDSKPLFDVAVLHHGFTPHMRDYDILIEADWKDDLAGRYIYRFTHCVEATVETLIPDKLWVESWADAFTDFNKWLEADEPSGFVWGVCWSMAYPGYSYIVDSEKSKDWEERLGVEMHEIELETNTFMLRLIFHDVHINKISGETDLVKKILIPLSNE